MSKKIQILNSCLDCGLHEWMRGKPRCKHPNIRLKEPDINNDEFLLFPTCPTDSRKFREDCPLESLEE